MRSKIRSFCQSIRTDNWLNYKIPPLLAVGFAMALVSRMDPFVASKTMSLLFLSIFSVAAYGHIVNDIFDIEQDREIGKRNLMINASPSKRIAYCSIAVICGFAPLLLLNSGYVPLVLLSVNYLLPTFYSIPPLRLKERGFLGVMADALGAHGVPTLFVASSMSAAGAGAGKTGLVIAASAFTWSLFAGLRGIIAHQVSDRGRDTQANVMTFARSKSRKYSRSIVLRYFYPFEAAGIFCFVCLIAPVSVVTTCAVIVYMAGEFAKMRLGWKLPLFYPECPSREPYLILVNNEFYEFWLPFALGIQLCFESIGYCFLLAVYLLVAMPVVKERLIIMGIMIADLKRRIFRGADEGFFGN